jgi:hypothetical protein
MGARATTVGDQHPHRHDAQGAEWPSAGPRRIEVIRGSYRRPWRRWTKGNKARTTTESFAPSGTVLGMARPHGAPAGPASARPIQAPANPRLFDSGMTRTGLAGQVVVGRFAWYRPSPVDHGLTHVTPLFGDGPVGRAMLASVWRDIPIAFEAIRNHWMPHHYTPRAHPPRGPNGRSRRGLTLLRPVFARGAKPGKAGCTRRLTNLGAARIARPSGTLRTVAGCFRSQGRANLGAPTCMLPRHATSHGPVAAQIRPDGPSGTSSTRATRSCPPDSGGEPSPRRPLHLKKGGRSLVS